MLELTRRVLASPQRCSLVIGRPQPHQRLFDPGMCRGTPMCLYLSVSPLNQTPDAPEHFQSAGRGTYSRRPVDDSRRGCRSAQGWSPGSNHSGLVSGGRGPPEVRSSECTGASQGSPAATSGLVGQLGPARVPDVEHAHEGVAGAAGVAQADLSHQGRVMGRKLHGWYRRGPCAAIVTPCSGSYCWSRADSSPKYCR